MYWQQDNDASQPYTVPDEIIDLSFKVACQGLPLDHAFVLSTALLGALPWLREEKRSGIHLIHGAESGNGWIRPEGRQAVMYLSRRTRMTLRLPKERIEEAKCLMGRTLDVGGNALTLGSVSVRALSNLTTLFARYIIVEQGQDESVFLDQAASNLKDMGIRVKKMLCGRSHRFSFPDGDITVRSLMIDGLEVAQSVALQQQGLGLGRKIGCGLFLPHRGIEAVKKTLD
ncbi:MAG: type I-MYXAN CRISPR-associated protein Cas6/Cmx6 [Gammaproteobacteria bacterium]|nr:type I-MYXAN CRISPR-associated protein Cas6/Cmx6 [Gammaproteobacteria bacterium]